VGGSNPGFNSFGIILSKDKSGWVAMTNGDNGAKILFNNPGFQAFIGRLLAA